MSGHSDMGSLDNIKHGPFFYNDPPFQEKALPNSGSIESEVFDWANVQGGIRLLVYLNEDITLAAEKTVTIELLGSDEKDGTFDKVISSSLKEGAASTGTSLKGESELLDIVSLPEHPKYAKLKITTDSDMSAATVTGRLAYIAR